ncbi:aldehyde dehydrogenase family protein [Granulicella sp. dw_53]|uniref:aldehyde dehydrogenase family protein n=1 Tax=Granulicella sp. dw_53 TaxID=2719792 RepID=UPI001BD28932|nr:aldehyde dehydrogenase family protein [Granulicella sp. dw_53]
MVNITTHYINGQFVESKGQEKFGLINPSSNQLLGHVTLGNVEDTQDAIAAAKAAFKTFSTTTREERLDWLQRLYDALKARAQPLSEAMVEEFGAPVKKSPIAAAFSTDEFLHVKKALSNFNFVREMGNAKVIFEPLGVTAVITPWNSNALFICRKMGTAIAAGCTTVIKPSEMSAIQTQVLVEALHEAGLPPGVFNVVVGRGDVVGAELTRHPDVAKISFTGSTATGKTIAKGAVDTMKRVTLELGGKSANIILDDADFAKAIPLAIMNAFLNNGEACNAGTRLLVPEDRLDEVKKSIKHAVEQVKVGNCLDEDTFIGPLVSRKQYERVQGYIKSGVEEGAELVTGGLGHPQGLSPKSLEEGNFVRPTVFANVTRNMRIAQEEIFGPVLSILTYKTDEEAIEIANDSIYGLYAYISSSDMERANRIASQLQVGRVSINGAPHDTGAPFGGFKQSGIGREYGEIGLEAYLEPKAILGS